MKRIIKLFVLIFICLPFMVDAKATLNFEWKVDDALNLYKNDGKYYFADFKSFDFENAVVYDGNGNELEPESLNFDQNMTVEEFYNNKVLLNFYKLEGLDLRYNSQFDKYIMVSYFEETIGVYEGSALVSAGGTEIPFTEVDTVKQYLGDEITLYQNLKDQAEHGTMIYKEEDFYIAVLENDNDTVYKVYNKNLELVLDEVTTNFYIYDVHVFNNKIYFFKDNEFINIYDLEGNLLDSLDVYSEFTKLYGDKDIHLGMFNIYENNLIISYQYELESMGTSPSNKAIFDRKNFFNDTAKDALNLGFASLKFRLTFDVERVSDKNGSFTSESKVDENDMEYIELKITPNTGYEVDKIIITDVYGNNIDIIDNKFFMPNSDVKVEVQFRGAEYVPIPDTFLNMNYGILIIALLLISTGLYILYVNIRTRKVNQE